MAADSVLTLPFITAPTTAARTGTAAVSRMAIVAAGQAGEGVAVPFPYIVAAGTGVVGVVTDGAFSPSVLLPSIIARGQGAFDGVSAQTLLRKIASGAGSTSILGVSAQTLLAVLASGFGYPSNNGVSEVTLYPIQPVGFGGPGMGANCTAVAMHTEAQGLTTYSNFRFNSFGRFNGAYLAASDTGLYVLDGAETDAGVNIDAAFRGAVFDFNTLHLKKVDRLYVGYRTSGNLLLRLTTDGTQVRDYRMQATGKTGFHGNFVRLGKGVEAQYFQFEIQNINGAGFDIDMLEFKPTVLRRRVSGNHA